MANISEALFAGRAGINAHGAAISVLADNIANVNTVGFKASRPDFIDLISGSIGKAQTGLGIGSGSEVGRVTQVFNQGTLEFTGRSLDVGIDGSGFFVTENNGARFYTRAGNFQLDEDGNLLDQNGFNVMGFPVSGTGALEALNINDRVLSSIETGRMDLNGNLDASAGLVASPGGTSFSALSAAASFQTNVEVFDSLGAKHNITLYYFHTTASDWSVEAYADAGELGGTAGDAALLNSVTLSFGGNGLRTTAAPVGGDVTLAPAWSNGANAGDIDLFFEPYTAFSAPSAVDSLRNDGRGAGSVVSFIVEGSGELFALLDNGERANVGTIALANFSNIEGLRRVGSSLWAETNSSGQAVVGTPESGQFGSLEGGALELSTTDLASDFVKLISYQRGFQGSSRIIGNVDELLNELLNLI